MITLYTIGCPRCNILESKLNNKNIDYNIVDDGAKIVAAGFGEKPMPILVVNDKILEFSDANKWVNAQ